MGRARLNKGTKKRVITSVERQIVCFSVGSPLKRNVPRTKGESRPHFDCKATNFRNKHKPKSQKTFHFIKIHSNNTPTLHAGSRQKLVYYFAKTETFSTKLHCFIHRRPIRPHFLLATPLLPLYARIRALSEFSFFAFTLHRPQYLPHYWRIRGEGNALNCLHPTKKFPTLPQRAKKHRERRPYFSLLAAFTLAFTLNTLYINPMQGTNFIF